MSIVADKDFKLECQSDLAMTEDDRDLISAALTSDEPCLCGEPAINDLGSRPCPACDAAVEAVRVLEVCYERVVRDAEERSKLEEKLDELEVQYDARGHQIAVLEGKVRS